MKALFSTQRTSRQLFLLVLLIAIGSLLSSLFGLGLFQLICGTSTGMEQHPDMMRLFQFITAVGTFLLPALLTAWLCSDQPKAYLGLNGIPDGRLVILVVAGMILLNPVISLTSMLNESMQLPAWAAHQSDCYSPDGCYLRRIPLPWYFTADHRTLDNQPTRRCLDLCHSFQCFPPAVLRIHSAYDPGSLLRLSDYLDPEYMAAGSGAFLQ